jgi:pyruvate/2-oxoglutarate dehydrogenase complex dihydrolipoamide acyltransferase (E2) component
MLVGYNHNIRYKGDVFHVQTEDSGINNPHIITLLYRGGTILASKKTSYADILKIENLEQVVEELMKEQHKEILRKLKAGDYDSRAFPGQSPSAPQAPNQPEAETLPEPAPAAWQGAAPAPVSAPAPAAAPVSPMEPAPPRRAQIVQPEGRRATTLDEIILDYLLTDDNER